MCFCQSVWGWGAGSGLPSVRTFQVETTDAQAGTGLSPIRSRLPPGIPETLNQLGLTVWTALFGVLSATGERIHPLGGEESLARRQQD